ncbi:MAG: GPW/gp25 family protein [Cytophagaceae bacterium]
MKHNKTFLGIGWKFPPTFEKESGSVMLVSEEDDIRESLHILLSTKPGERVMLPEFGCNIQSMIFENLNNTLKNEMRGRIEHAVLYFEPRIILEEISVEESPENPEIINIKLDYTIRKTNKRTNMVYPFYLIEGTNVRYKPA